jgi:hypothetical protein
MQLTFLILVLLGFLFLITLIIFNTLLYDKTLAYVRLEKTNLDLKIENIKYRVLNLRTKILGDST